MTRASQLDPPDHTCYRSEPVHRIDPSSPTGVSALPCDPDESRCPRCIWGRWQVEVATLKELLRASVTYLPFIRLREFIRVVLGDE